MVTRESATESVQGEEIHHQISIPADHLNMVKFDGRADPSYELVLGVLKDMFRKKSSIVTERSKRGMYKTRFTIIQLPSLISCYSWGPRA